MIHLRKIIPGAITLCAALSLPISMQAAVCSVPSGSYPTIQSAANDASCSDINVAAGAYSENVVVNNPTTINGAQAGMPVSGRTSGSGAESTVSGANPVGSNPVFMIKAADVTIDGFTIKNAITSGSAVGVDIKNTASRAFVMNNFIDGITTADTGGNGTAQGVYLEAGPDNTTIQDNVIENVHGARSTKGVHIGDSGSSDPSVGVKIQGNSIHDITSDVRGGYGVSINNGNGLTANSGLQVLNNNIFNINGGGWLHAIGLEASTPNVVVNGNTISSLTGPAGNTFGVWFEGEEGSSFSSGAVNANNFNLPATQAGIAVDPVLSTAFPSANVDGTCNWWNSMSGPTVASNPGGTGAATTANVVYKPWLLAPAPGGNCFGGNVPTTASQCKNGGWMTSVRADGSTFKNQGDCIQYVNTGK
jgi:hypothetical protein